MSQLPNVPMSQSICSFVICSFVIRHSSFVHLAHWHIGSLLTV